MSEHVRVSLDDGRGAGKKSRLYPRTNVGRARVIILLALLAIAISTFAVVSVAIRSTEEVPDEVVGRAAEIERALTASAVATEPEPGDVAAPVTDAGRPGRARQSPPSGSRP